jgi:hypothetical protein
MFKHGTGFESVRVALGNPDALLDAISKHMEKKSFIALDWSQDRHSWLLVPKSFDIDAFCKITGGAFEQPKVTQAQRPPEEFAEGYKVREKIFFTPQIIYIGSDKTGFDMPGQVWSGRILPGQTVRDGTAAELMTELKYSGRFDYAYDGYLGVTKDRRGKNIKRYGIKVYLYDKSFQSKMAGSADIRLRERVGEKFSHPDESV